MNIKAKICGLSNKEGVTAAIENGAEYVGFVFLSKSPRNISPEKAAEISKKVNIKKVAVVVDADDSLLQEISNVLKPDLFQLHGDENPERVKEIKELCNIPVIKAISVRNSDDVSKIYAYKDVADMLLFDAKASEGALSGGNGLSFNWHLLEGRDFPLPWILSGGINADNVKEAVSISGTEIVDVSSSLESSPGVKEPKLIEEFLRVVNDL